MIMPDVNILVYAHRRDEEVHAAYAEWLRDAAEGPAPVVLSSLVAVGFVRIVTNRRIFASPTPLFVALDTIDALLAHPGCVMVSPGERHWTIVRRLLTELAATGKLVADAQHAAVAMEHGAVWVSRDADFATFAPLGLSWRHLVLPT